MSLAFVSLTVYRYSALYDLFYTTLFHLRFITNCLLIFVGSHNYSCFLLQMTLQDF